jgi:TPR repeat protein
MMDDDELIAREPDYELVHRAYALMLTDISKALSELETLANKGSVMSMLYLGWVYWKKLEDRTNAERWYKLAYQNGSSTALVSLGMIYFLKKDYLEAEKIFLDGVSQNDGASMYWLGRIYLLRSRNEITSTRIRALWEDAAARGQVLAKYSLGYLFLKGRYGIGNIPRGIWLFLTALVDGFKVAYRDPSSRRLW